MAFVMAFTFCTYLDPAFDYLNGFLSNSQQTHQHTMVKTDAKEATCTEDGNNAYWTCSGCEKVYADAEGKTETTVLAQVVNAKGHTPGAEETTYSTVCIYDLDISRHYLKAE